MLQENKKFRPVHSSQVPTRLNYMNREHHSYEVEKHEFLTFPFPTITEGPHDGKERPGEDTGVLLSYVFITLNQLNDTGQVIWWLMCGVKGWTK